MRSLVRVKIKRGRGKRLGMTSLKQMPPGVKQKGGRELG